MFGICTIACNRDRPNSFCGCKDFMTCQRGLVRKCALVSSAVALLCFPVSSDGVLEQNTNETGILNTLLEGV